MSKQESKEAKIFAQNSSPHQIPPKRYPFSFCFHLYYFPLITIRFCSFPLLSFCFSLIEKFSRDDAVYEELQKGDSEKKPLPRDEDLPGMGQYYCLHCDRYFANVDVRDEHFKTKRHKKRLKQMSGPAPHTQLDAELAAGMGMPDNGPTLMSM
ncbi:hypothetical protein PTKIN_Ptkin13bG0266100 [Pterospermum kingtungense]